MKFFLATAIFITSLSLNATVTNNISIIRNYIIAATTITLMSVGIADLYNNPQVVAQQKKLDTYAPYIRAGLVSYGKSLARQ